jgi:outer membrane protein insertion porin family/translocation and assembly module TamA
MSKPVQHTPRAGLPHTHSAAHRAFKLLLAAGASGCASLPAGRSAVDSVQIVGAHAVDAADVADRLATDESPRFLGLFQGVANDYTIYDPSVVQRDLARVERYYRGRGFFEAHARVARVIRTGEAHVRVEFVVEEGPPVQNGDVAIEGLDAVPAAAADAVRAAIARAVPAGGRFNEGAYQDARVAAVRALTDRGYAYATGTAGATVDLAAHTIAYRFALKPGIPVVYGPLSFVGLDPDGAGPEPQEISDSLLRGIVGLRPGAPYSTEQIDSATQALLDLEVFSGVHLVPGLTDPPSTVAPMVVQVEPAKLRTIHLGVGGEFDEVKTDAHALVGWEDHNFLGNLRDLSVDLKPGVVFYPTNLAFVKRPTDYFPEEWLKLQFRQPHFLEARTEAFVQPEFNVYPLLVESNLNSDEIAAQNVVGYVEPKLAVGLQRRVRNVLFFKAVYNVQGERPFSYKGPLDPNLPNLLLLFPQLIAQLDLRDDPNHPHAGMQANLDLQYAFGGTANDVRVQPDVEAYVPIARGVTFAVNVQAGFLFPTSTTKPDYSSIQNLDKSPLPAPLSDAGRRYDEAVETIYFRGFSSGGPNSNRGYPLRGIAPHGFVTFLNPATASVQAANRECDPARTPIMTIEKDQTCLRSIGGFTQWEASAEVRFAISGPFGGATFCDAGDVSQTVFPAPGSLRFDRLHMSCGLGARYDTPVGPIRLDLGYRIPPLQIVGEPDEYHAGQRDPTFGSPPRILEQPIAIAFGIGEAF